MNTSSLLRRISVCVALLFALVAPALAQGKWWQQDHRYFRELKLTMEQSRRLEEVFQQAVPGLRAAKASLDKAEKQFDALMEKGGDHAIMEQLNHVETARAELNKARYMMLLRMKNVLLQDQWAKFTALHNAAERERMQRANGASGGASK